MPEQIMNQCFAYALIVGAVVVGYDCKYAYEVVVRHPARRTMGEQIRKHRRGTDNRIYRAGGRLPWGWRRSITVSRVNTLGRS